MDGYVQDISLQADGKILLGGFFGQVDGAARTSVARLDGDGLLDPAFVPRVTRLDNSLSTVQRIFAIDAAKILVLGHLRQVNGTARDYLARLTSNGDLDASFNPQFVIQGFDAFSGKTLVGSSPIPYAATVQPDGKTLVGGSVVWDALARGYVLRLDSTGKMDRTFVPESIATNVILLNSTAKRIRLTTSTNILVCGDFTEVRGHPSRPQRGGVARFGANGALDDSFITRMGANRPVEDIALQPDGKILLAGSFKRYEVYDYPGSDNCIRVGRLEANGTLDAKFSSGIGPNDTVSTVIWMPNHCALIAGAFTNYNNTLRPGIARIYAASDGGAVVPALSVTLEMGRSATFFWPTNAVGFALEFTDKLGLGSPWQIVTQSFGTSGSQYFYTAPDRAGTRYFRLKKP